MRDSFFRKIFPIFFGVIFTVACVLIVGGFILTAFLGYDCYRGGDPNSMSCYMISKRYEIGIRQR